MKRIAPLIFASIFLLGCPYYNTFYNARKAFNEAEKMRREALKRGAPLPEQARDLYDKAIENSALVLRDHAGSSLVDDALVLIGDAFVAQGEYPKAARKYEEVLINYPESDWAPYCAFALGQASLSAGDTIRAEEALRVFLLQHPGGKWAPDAHMLLGEMAINRQQFQTAVDEYTDFLTSFPKHRRRPEAQFHIAQSYLELDRRPEALDLFEKVSRAAKDRNLEYRANYMVGECLRLDQKYQTALQTFEKLVKKSSYLEYRPELILAIASCQRSLNQIDEALENLRALTERYEKDRQHDAEVSQALFELGSIYEQRGDIKKAEQFYLDAKSRSPRAFWVTAEADQKSNDLHRLQQYQEDLLKALATLHNTATADTAQEAPIPDETTVADAHTIDPESLQRVIETRFRLAETYLFRFNMVDSALVQYRRAEEEAGDTESAAKAGYAQAWVLEHVLADTTASRAGYRNLLAEYDSTSYASAAARALSIPDPLGPSDAELFHRGEDLLFTEQQPDSALIFYRQVVDKFPDSDYAPRALYAIGWIAETSHTALDSALNTYRHLTETYPGTEEALQAKLKIRYMEELLAEFAQGDSMATADSVGIVSAAEEIPTAVSLRQEDRHGEVVALDGDKVVVRLRPDVPVRPGAVGYLFTAPEDSASSPVRAANIRIEEINAPIEPRIGTNAGANINIFDAPEGNIQTILPPDRTIEVLEDHEDWLKVRVDDQEGYVRPGDLTLPPAPEPTVICRIEKQFQPLTMDIRFNAFFDTTDGHIRPPGDVPPF